MKQIIRILMATAAIATLLPVASAQARGHSRWVSVQGGNGRGYVRQRTVMRQPGSVLATHSLQTNDGRSAASTRNATWGNGIYQGSATHTRSDGTTYGRTTTTARNTDGSVSYTSNRTGLDGGTRSVSGTTAPHP